MICVFMESLVYVHVKVKKHRFKTGKEHQPRTVCLLLKIKYFKKIIKYLYAA